MCGFCGIFLFENGIGVDPSLIARMSAILTHRGPDDAGVHIKGQIGLGHQRLSIIDVAGGHQPMEYRTHDNFHIIVYNGEIYNYLALRQELKTLGHTFKTASDTEVLLTAYMEWGCQCVNRLQGMFAFAIWDEAKKAFFLGRDRMGIKPLYYYLGRKAFVFASEVRAILASSMVPSELEKSVLDSFLTLGYTPSPKTMFKGIIKLMPGHTMTVEANGTMKLKAYWNFNRITPTSLAFPDAVKKLREVLWKSVRMHLMSEVPLGIFLSGGLDSSAITALMCQMSSQPVKTFSVGCEAEEASNELPFARKISNLFCTEHHEIILKPLDFFESIPRMVEMAEEPLVEFSAIALYQIAAASKPHATVLLSGEGSDEVFGGYGLYQKMLNMDRTGGVAKFFGLIPDSCLPGDRLKKYADWLSNSVADRYRGTSSDLTERIKRSFYSPELFQYTKKNNYLDDTFLKWFGDVEGQPLLSQLLYVDSKTWLPDDLLLKADKMTMATSAELRVPFLDHKIVEFAASLPPEYKVHKGEGKFILKKLMEKYLPNEIIYRKKMGFTVPTKSWFAGDLLGPAKDIIFSKRLMDTGWFQRKYLETMFDRHSKGKEDYSRRIFSLLVLYHWLEIFG